MQIQTYTHLDSWRKDAHRENKEISKKHEQDNFQEKRNVKDIR